MASSISSSQNGVTDHILRPRPVKAINPTILRAVNEESNLKTNGHTEKSLSGLSR